MNKIEREEYIKKVTKHQISFTEMIRNVVHYYDENGALIAKYYPLKDKLTIM